MRHIGQTRPHRCLQISPTPPEGDAAHRGRPRAGCQDARVRRFNLLTPEYDQAREREGYRSRSARVAQALGAEQIAARLVELGPGQHGSPYHFHHGLEEWVIVVAGTPVVRTPEGERSLQKGDVVCFPAGARGAHQVTGPGTVLMVSDRRSPDVVEYPDSGKVLVSPPGTVFRSADAVDLWDDA
jgi:uncharacterized cupin superfamily protein